MKMLRAKVSMELKLMAKYLMGLDNRGIYFLSLEGRSPGSGCQQDQVLARALSLPC